MQIVGLNNKIDCGNNIALSGSVTGENNTVSIGNANAESQIHLFINGNNNSIFIEKSHQMKYLSIYCGIHVESNKTSTRIAENFSIENGGRVLIYNSEIN